MSKYKVGQKLFLKNMVVIIESISTPENWLDSKLKYELRVLSSFNFNDELELSEFSCLASEECLDKYGTVIS